DRRLVNRRCSKECGVGSEQRTASGIRPHVGCHLSFTCAALAAVSVRKKTAQQPQQRILKDSSNGSLAPSALNISTKETLMKRLLIVLPLLFVVGEADAIERHDMSRMTCAEVQSTLKSEGTAILRSPSSRVPGMTRYDVYASNRNGCGVPPNAG